MKTKRGQGKPHKKPGKDKNMKNNKANNNKNNNNGRKANNMKKANEQNKASERARKGIENANNKTEQAKRLIETANDPNAGIIAKHMARMQLIFMLTCNMHELKYNENGEIRGGKIAGIPSLDGHAVSCAFCSFMRDLANKFPELKIICGTCYACDAREQMKATAQIAHARNALILSSVEFTAEELAALPIPCDVSRPYCRFNEDGDVVNETHARNLLKIANTHIFIGFGLWYKNRAAVYPVLDEEGVPENVEIIFSVPRVSLKPEQILKLAGRHDNKVFAVFETDEEVDNAVNNFGFVRCNGIKCIICGFRCYKKAGRVLFIAEKKRGK